MENGILGYSVKDISYLEGKAEEFKRKRNICIIIGVTIAAIAIIGGIFAVYYMLRYNFDMINSSLTYAERNELARKAALWEVVLSLFGVVEAGGDALALSGGITNHIKGKRRLEIARQLKALKREMDNPAEEATF